MTFNIHIFVSKLISPIHSPNVFRIKFMVESIMSPINWSNLFNEFDKRSLKIKKKINSNEFLANSTDIY